MILKLKYNTNEKWQFILIMRRLYMDQMFTHLARALATFMSIAHKICGKYTFNALDIYLGAMPSILI